MKIAEWRQLRRSAPPPMLRTGLVPVVIATRSVYAGGPSALRRQLFASICAASLRGQTDSDFVWLIKIDPTEDLSWRRDITHDLNVVFTAEPWLSAIGQLKNRDSLSVGLRMVRMDDDDAITSDFVARMKRPEFQAGTWLTFPQGYRVSDGKCEPYRNLANQFVACDLNELASVYDVRHRELEQQPHRGMLRVIDELPAWCFVRHAESKSPGGRNNVTRSLAEIVKLFAVEPSAWLFDSALVDRLQRLHLCQHRGQQIETLNCKPCQNSFGVSEIPVFSCSHKHRTHHPRCVITTVAAVGSDGMRPQACATCSLRKA